MALVRALIKLLTEPPSAAIVVPALGAAAQNPELAGYARAFFADRLASELAMFTRASERGELATETDPMLVVDALAGAVWVRVVLRQLPVEDDFAEKLASLMHVGPPR